MFLLSRGSELVSLYIWISTTQTETKASIWAAFSLHYTLTDFTKILTRTSWNMLHFSFLFSLFGVLISEAKTGGSSFCFFWLFSLFFLLVVSLFLLLHLLFLIFSLTSLLSTRESLIPQSDLFICLGPATLTSGMSSSTLQAMWYGGKGLDQPPLVQLRLTEPEVKGEEVEKSSQPRRG